MYKSFSIRVIEKNPPQNKFSTLRQQAMIKRQEHVNIGEPESKNTWYQLNNPQFMHGISRYIAYHELKIVRTGRPPRGEEFNYYYEPHNFQYYMDSHRNLIYISAKKNVAKSFINAIKVNKDWPPLKINYEIMMPLLPTITGSWFCDLKLQYVSSAGYYGQHVDRSEEFKKAAKEGKISIIYINVSMLPSDREQRIGITSDGAIIIPRGMELEEQEIELVTHVYDKYLLPTLGV